jgi:hypothetical protein
VSCTNAPITKIFFSNVTCKPSFPSNRLKPSDVSREI